MKIDFHCHTKAVKKGEKETRNIEAKEFKEIIINANVKMVAITNHNTFDREQYDQFKEEINNAFILLPGIEFDVIGVNSEKGHVVIVYDDADVDNFTQKISELVQGSTPDTFTINIDDLISFINSINCIIMAHYCKPHSLEIASINKIRNEIKDNYRLFYEPSNYRTLGIMINHNFRALKGTDIKDWDDYNKQDFANIKLDIDSYKQLMLFLKKDDTVIESLLNKQTTYSIDISYKKGEHEIVDFYDGINVFFGAKGTGKSVSLDKIKKFFLSKGKSVSDYSPSETKDKLDKKLEVKTDEKKLEKYDKDNCEREFQKLNSWVDSSVTQFSDYYNYVKYKDSNENKKRMKIVEIDKMLGYNLKDLENARTMHENVEQAASILKEINLSKFISLDEIQVLNVILEKIYKGSLDEYENVYCEEKAVELTNKTTNILKTVVEKKTETKTIPSTTGFSLFFKNRVSLELQVEKILTGFSFSLETAPEFIGVLEEGKILERKTFITMLNKKSKAEDGFTSIKELKEIKSKIEEIKQNIYTEKIGEVISDFQEIYTQKENLSLDSFVGVVKKFVLDGVEYEPSTGESTMIILDESLEEKYDIYILDEPEKSLGNNYISDVLVPRINDLARMKKIIIIATHNANIAVRTLPYRSILKAYFNGEYKTYIGNPYTNKLINIKDSEDIRDWKEESIKILEGGREAFEERGDIYAE